MLALHHTPNEKKKERRRVVNFLPRVFASKLRQLFLQPVEQLISDVKISCAQLMFVNRRMTIVVAA